MKMSRLTVRALAVVASLATVACSADAPLATAPSAGPQFARGSSSSSTPSVSVAGVWTSTTFSATNPNDSTVSSLYLTQKDNRLEGSLTRILYINGSTFLGVSAVKTGSISGQIVSLEFDKGEGAETRTIFSASVSDDGRTMDGFHSRLGELTLTRR